MMKTSEIFLSTISADQQERIALEKQLMLKDKETDHHLL